jgi:acetyl-CoA acetyltransferase
MQDIYIHGGAMTPFGRHPGVLAPELAQQAILKALADADVPAGRIQAVYCANVLGGMILGQLIVRDLGLKGIPVYNVENACASGATGVHLARHALVAGQYDTVLVFGTAAYQPAFARL